MYSLTTYNKYRSTRIDYTEEVPMKKEIYNLEGIEIEVEKYDNIVDMKMYALIREWYKFWFTRL